MGLGEYAKKKVSEAIPVKKIAIYGGGALAVWAAIEVGPTAADIWHSMFVSWDISGVLDDINHTPPISYLHEWLNGKPDAMGETTSAPQPILEYSMPADEIQHIALPLRGNIVDVAAQQ